MEAIAAFDAAPLLGASSWMPPLPPNLDDLLDDDLANFLTAEDMGVMGMECDSGEDETGGSSHSSNSALRAPNSPGPLLVTCADSAQAALFMEPLRQVTTQLTTGVDNAAAPALPAKACKAAPGTRRSARAATAQPPSPAIKAESGSTKVTLLVPPPASFATLPIPTLPIPPTAGTAATAPSRPQSGSDSDTAAEDNAGGSNKGQKRKAPDVDWRSIEDPVERRRQRRLAKNRVTAARSRERKKSQWQVMEDKLRGLEEENGQLRALLTAATRDNKSLKDRLASLSKGARAAGGGAAGKAGGTTFDPAVVLLIATMLMLCCCLSAESSAKQVAEAIAMVLCVAGVTGQLAAKGLAPSAGMLEALTAALHKMLATSRLARTHLQRLRRKHLGKHLAAPRESAQAPLSALPGDVGALLRCLRTGLLESFPSAAVTIVS